MPQIYYLSTYVLYVDLHFLYDNCKIIYHSFGTIKPHWESILYRINPKCPRIWEPSSILEACPITDSPCWPTPNTQYCVVAFCSPVCSWGAQPLLKCYSWSQFDPHPSVEAHAPYDPHSYNSLYDLCIHTLVIFKAIFLLYILIDPSRYKSPIWRLHLFLTHLYGSLLLYSYNPWPVQVAHTLLIQLSLAMCQALLCSRCWREESA